VGDAGDDDLFHPLSSLVTSVPGSRLNVERTCTATPYFLANSTERAWRTLAPRLAISSISSYATRGNLRASGTMFGSAVYTPSTSV